MKARARVYLVHCPSLNPTSTPNASTALRRRGRTNLPVHCMQAVISSHRDERNITYRGISDPQTTTPDNHFSPRCRGLPVCLVQAVSPSHHEGKKVTYRGTLTPKLPQMTSVSDSGMSHLRQSVIVHIGSTGDNYPGPSPGEPRCVAQNALAMREAMHLCRVVRGRKQQSERQENLPQRSGGQN